MRLDNVLMALGAGSVSHPEDVECCPTFKCLYPGKLLSCFKIVDRSIPRSIHPASHPSIHPFNQFHSYMHPCSHACIHAYLHPYYIPPTTYLLPSIHRFMHASMHPSFMHKCVHTTRGIHVSMPPACILPKFFYKQFWSDKDLQDWRNLTAFVLCESCRTRLAAILRPVACS